MLFQKPQHPFKSGREVVHTMVTPKQAQIDIKTFKITNINYQMEKEKYVVYCTVLSEMTE